VTATVAREPGSAGATSTASAGRLPVSWLSPSGQIGEGDNGRGLVAAARSNVQTLVRACWPGTLAPRLASTRLGFAFVAARHTGVGVRSRSSTVTERLLRRLRLWGYPGTRLAPDAAASDQAGRGSAIAFRPGSREAAQALAGDLGLPPGSVFRADDAPRKLVLTTGD